MPVAAAAVSAARARSGLLPVADDAPRGERRDRRHKSACNPCPHRFLLLPIPVRFRRPRYAAIPLIRAERASRFCCGRNKSHRNPATQTNDTAVHTPKAPVVMSVPIW